MELLYKVKDRPKVGNLLAFALQQLLAILAGTISLPIIVGNGMSQSAALFGASVGTLVYLVLTKFKSPVFLGSSFTYLGSMASAFAGAASMAIGYVGLIIGAGLAGLVYVILSIIVRFAGSGWVEKVMPPVITGSVVIVIALTLAPNAVNNIQAGDFKIDGQATASTYLCIFVGLATLAITALSSVFGKGIIKQTPFIFGIIGGYLIALLFTAIGNGTGNYQLSIIDYSPFQNMRWYPDFTFLHAFEARLDFHNPDEFWRYFGFIAASYVPIAFAVFSEHIADHKNISHIIETDLLKDPGLKRTLLGDGLGSMVGAFFGGCPNTTYGESISCIAFSKNASVITIVATCFMGIVVSFFGPLMSFFATIPTCVIGGLSIALYGFIAISGLQMLKSVDMYEQKNIVVESTVLITGVGGIAISFVHFTFPTVAMALVLGVLMNGLVHIKNKKKTDKDEEKPQEIPQNEQNQ